MKIRHKQSGVEVEVSHSPKNVDFKAQEYFGSWDGSLYSKTEWELVQVEPPPKWVNVTAECKEYTGWWHGNELIVPHLPLHRGYRLRKVRVAIKDESDPYGKYCYGDFHAFIIEQRQP